MSNNPLAAKIEEMEVAEIEERDDKLTKILKAIDSFCLECPLSQTKECNGCFLYEFSQYNK